MEGMARTADTHTHALALSVALPFHEIFIYLVLCFLAAIELSNFDLNLLGHKVKPVYNGHSKIDKTNV